MAITADTPLTYKQTAFINAFMETNSVTEAAIKAGYSQKSAYAQGSRLLRDVRVKAEIARRREALKKASIATAQEVMEYFTKVMNGEIKDQFGLEASLAERTKAAQELAKRTVDIDNRVNGKADGVLEIKIDWGE